MEYEYILEDESYPDDAVTFVSSWSSGNTAYVAEDAGEEHYDNDPDPECSPVKLEIFEDGKSLGKFEIFLDYEPTFSAVLI